MNDYIPFIGSLVILTVVSFLKIITKLYFFSALELLVGPLHGRLAGAHGEDLVPARVLLRALRHLMPRFERLGYTSACGVGG